MSNDEAGRRIAEALHARASSSLPQVSRHRAAASRQGPPPGLPRWLVWAGAVLLGAVAGMLAALVSAL